ncbi:universal stress protein [Sphaerimonospora mesophila]|uniref:universal stress protein n=1 Tax=Sphaerimonospora mesophila TaxID=37483 RepID=UPI0006E37010
MTEPIVVATDGSPAATAAVEWAADDAARKRLPLRIVHVLDRLPYDIPRYPIPDVYDHLSRSGGQILDEAERTARERWPDVEVTVEMAEGDPVHILRRQAEHALELVVGSRGLGGFTGMLLGSVSMHVAGQVEVPVVVVRPGAATVHSEIVAGFDGSPESEAALAYAFEEAVVRGGRLRVVHAWQMPVYVYAPELAYDMDETRQAHEDFVTDRLTAWRERYPGVDTVLDAVSAHPVTALVEASAEADLLVVGSRGRGAVRSLVLGSVSRAVLHHARCPVAVVRSKAPVTGESPQADT